MTEFEVQSICYQDFGALTTVTTEGNFIVKFWYYILSLKFKFYWPTNALNYIKLKG